MCLPTALFALVAGYAGSANAQAWHTCPDNPNWNPPNSPAGCTKEIRIYNNFPKDPSDADAGKIYVLLQGSLQQGHPSLGNCPVLPMLKGGGDVWLQRALNDATNCYQVTNNYYAYINPTSGIKPGEFVSVNVPWWSKGAPGEPDKYVDWWNGARVYIFDDKAALNDSYMINQQTPAKLATPGVTCKGNKVDGQSDSCLPKELGIFRVAPDSMGNYNPQSPAQLNEFTFADIGPQPDFKTNSLNQNYNVSAVDQLYLPIAIERIASQGTPADIGYVGATNSAADFRDKMEKFTGSKGDPTKNWPVYNNPTVKGKKLYPDAGIRVPSTYNVLNFYANPSFFQAPLQNEPLILPYSSGISTLPAYVEHFMDQWKVCTKATDNSKCPLFEVYQPINQVFLKSYKTYFDNSACKPIPEFLKPDPLLDPLSPKLITFLSYVYGWVPFNFNCSAPDLPVRTMPPAQFGYTPIDYIELQYNYNTDNVRAQWFNPYTQFIHDPKRGGLGATPYAFSIDDSLSVQNNPGDGLILVVGGDHGLPNKNQVPPPVPVYDNWYDFVVGLGDPAPTHAPAWASYQICKTGVITQFPSATPQGWNLGVNPKWTTTFPCTITLEDTAGKKYEIEVRKAGIPPNAIWPPFTPGIAPLNFDPNVISCPSGANAQWCKNGVNETANPNVKPPFIISLRRRRCRRPKRGHCSSLTPR